MKKIKMLITTMAISAMNVVNTLATNIHIPTKEETTSTINETVSGGITIAASLLVLYGVWKLIFGIIKYANARKSGQAEENDEAKDNFLKAFLFILAAALVHFWVRGLISKMFGIG